MKLRFTVLAAFVASSGAFAQDVALRAGESADLFPVYWIANCKSILKSFGGADVLSGPASLKVMLREESVAARRQGCSEKVPGAILVLSADKDAAAFEGTVRLRVRYSTEDGDKQSTHPVKLLIVPPAK